MMSKFIGIGAVVAILLVGGFFIFNNHRIDPGNAGILVNYAAGSSAGKPVITPLQTGQYIFINPFSGKQLVEYPIAQQQLVLSSRGEEGEISGDSTVPCQMSGGGVLHIGLTVTWQVNSQHPEILYLKKPGFPLTSSLNNDVNTTLVYGAVRGDLLDVCTHYAWQDILGDGTTASKSDNLKQDLYNDLQRDLGVDGIVINQVFLQERIPDSTIQAVLNAKNQAAQSAYLAQKAQYEANAAIATAQGQAKAIQIINEQLAKSPEYIQYLIATKWDGKMPTYLATNGQSNPVLAALGQGK